MECALCKNRWMETMFGTEPCGAYEMEECDGRDIQCKRYVPETEEDEEYCPSSTARDYSPGNPWDAPEMSVRDFI